MSPEDEVRSVSERFYAALNRMLAGDPGELTKVWSHGGAVTAMHPVGGRDVGWERVAGSWSQIAKIASGGQVSLRDQHIQVAGDMAYEAGVETGQATLAGREVPIEVRVTNVYRQEAGNWRIVHHHADLSPAMQELVRNLQAGP